MRCHVVPLVLIALLVLFVGCREKQVTAYRVPKEKEPEHAPGDGHDHSQDKGAPARPSAPPPQMAGDMANTAVATAAGAGLTWTAPAHWQSKPASAMRKATYSVPGEAGGAAELAITAFPGDVGGEVANVNRWRGQIQLAPMSASEITGAITRLEQNGLKIGVIEMAGTGGTATRVLGAFVPHAGSTWFFKLSGPDAVVAKEKPAFLDFLKTLRPAAAP